MTNKERDEAIISIFQAYAENKAKCIGIGGLAGAVVHASYYAIALASLHNVLMVKPRPENEEQIARTVTIKPVMAEDMRISALIETFNKALPMQALRLRRHNGDHMERII